MAEDRNSADGGESGESNNGPSITPPSGNVLAWLDFFGRVADRFSVAGALIFFFFGAVWFFGSTKTRDDFIRELLFSDVTGTHYLQAFFFLLVMIAVYNTSLLFRWISGERREMKRVVKERNKLQERLIGEKLHSGDDPPNSTRGRARPKSRKMKQMQDPN